MSFIVKNTNTWGMVEAVAVIGTAGLHIPEANALARVGNHSCCDNDPAQE